MVEIYIGIWKAYSDVKGLETVAGGSPECHHLWTSVGDTDLKVTVCVLLFKNYANGFLYVNKETTGLA
jgi:hypothetical protein